MNDNKNKKKKGTPIGAIIFIALALVLANIDNSDAVPVIIVIAAIAGFILVIAIFSKAAKKTASQSKPAQRTYTAPVRRASVKDNCDYGADNCEYSHDEARRIKQLNDFLKNGTIDREEYRVLLERYRKEARAADIHRQ